MTRLRMIGTTLGMIFASMILAALAQAHTLQGKRVYMFRSAPHEVTLKWGKSTVFHQWTRCADPTPRVLRVWVTYGPTDNVSVRWCGRTRHRGWMV